MVRVLREAREKSSAMKPWKFACNLRAIRCSQPSKLPDIPVFNLFACLGKGHDRRQEDGSQYQSPWPYEFLLVKIVDGKTSSV